MSKVITVDELRDFMGKILNPAQAGQVVASINTYIETRTGICWGETKTASVSFIGRTGGFRYLRPDVVSVDSVKTRNWQTLSSPLASTYYQLNSNGRVDLVPSLWRTNLDIEYTYGRVDVPEDLHGAALAVAASLYNYAIEGQKTVFASQVGSYRVEYSARTADSASQSAAGLPWNIIDSYRAPRV